MIDNMKEIADKCANIIDKYPELENATFKILDSLNSIKGSRALHLAILYYSLAQVGIQSIEKIIDDLGIVAVDKMEPNLKDFFNTTIASSMLMLIEYDKLVENLMNCSKENIQ